MASEQRKRKQQTKKNRKNKLLFQNKDQTKEEMK
jgi:hypothetical protein